MDVSENSSDVPRPRLFEEAGSHVPVVGTGEVSEFSPGMREHWVFQVQDMRCSVAHPAGWRRLGPSAPDVLGTFTPPAGGGPELTIRMQRVVWEIDPIAFIMHLCHARGLTVTLARAYEDVDQTRYDVGGHRESDGARWRAAAFRHLGRFVMVETLAPSDRWDALCGIFQRCREAFEVLSTPRISVIEPRRHHRTKHLQFLLPASWAPDRLRGEEEQDGFVFSAGESGCRGVLVVHTGEVARALHRRQRAVLAELESRGYRATRRLTVQASGIRTFTGVLDGTLERDGETFQLRISHRRLRMTYVDYATVVPRGHPLSMDAMRTMRAIEIAIDSTTAHVDLEARTETLHRRPEKCNG